MSETFNVNGISTLTNETEYVLAPKPVHAPLLSSLRRYVSLAFAKATSEYLEEDRMYYSAIPGFRGVYATGETQELAGIELKEVLEEWIALRLRRGRALPAID